MTDPTTPYDSSDDEQQPGETPEQAAARQFQSVLRTRKRSGISVRNRCRNSAALLTRDQKEAVAQWLTEDHEACLAVLGDPDEIRDFVMPSRNGATLTD